MISHFISCALAIILFCCSSFAISADSIKIGTFYFPGWRDYQAGAPAKLPWERLKSYPEREPLLGWYDDGDPQIVEQQLKWMIDYGIDYIIYDWYWGGNQTFLSHGLNAYLMTESKSRIPFALLWANHTGVPKTKREFTEMVRFWIDRYFHRSEYMMIDGKPLLFIFSHPEFAKQSDVLGEGYAVLLAEAEQMARDAGYKGIYFVGGTHIHPSLVKQAAVSGYSAFSAYNYHGKTPLGSTSYAELDEAYQYIWGWIVQNSSIPYIVPMTQGWDKRPWGGSKNPLHDLSGGTPQEFKKHVQAARDFITANPRGTLNMGVICCWNEFGEGSYIEPTKKDKFKYLEIIKDTFK